MNKAEETFRIKQKRKADLGQFMTPSNVAGFMASLFPSSNLRKCRLLDAGAGEGALSCAFFDRWLAGGFDFGTVEATAYEIDESLQESLKRNLSGRKAVKANVLRGDFIELTAIDELHGMELEAGYTHAILNPPYKKINSRSSHRAALRRVGIETGNLYSAFVALAIAHAAPNGQVVAITPRSFCNGPYYRRFREFILERAAIRHIHLFESRNKVFKDEGVLQENIIICLERGGKQGEVTITTSNDATFADLTRHEFPFRRIVDPKDPEQCIHVPTSMEESALELSQRISYSLGDLRLKVSTGPIVDFRLKEYLCEAGEGAAPLLYPCHFRGFRAAWPIRGANKPNAILCNARTEKWLFPKGFYCVVRRLSSKEEKRRIIASVVNPEVFGESQQLGFENHLNVFHENKRGLPAALAHGLATFLNSTAVDENFRRLSGHTQVNATDLKRMRYPSRAALMGLGEWAMQRESLRQEEIDVKLGDILG